MDGCLNHGTAPVLAAVTGNKSLMKLAEKERGVLQRSHPQNAEIEHGGKNENPQNRMENAHPVLEI